MKTDKTTIKRAERTKIPEKENRTAREIREKEALGEVLKGAVTAAELLEAAAKAGENAYAPYSRFRVGAALLSETGKIYTGCNVESASFSPTCCAERTALCKAVSEGERRFAAVAVIGRTEGKSQFGFCPPCGVCRQLFREFCEETFRVILAAGDEKDGKFRFSEVKEVTLGELLPQSFGANSWEPAEQSADKSADKS